VAWLLWFATELEDTLPVSATASECFIWSSGAAAAPLVSFVNDETAGSEGEESETSYKIMIEYKKHFGYAGIFFVMQGRTDGSWKQKTKRIPSR
jgi:hypothetical protein